jgi:cell fate regulator YaaT (PSP1 superfamily)
MILDLVGIRFQSTAKIYHFNANGIEMRIGEKCIVQTERGEEIGTVVIGFNKIEIKEPCPRVYKKVLRKATEEDCEIFQRKANREKEAQNYCIDKIRERKMPMKLVNSELSSDGKKITFYFTADGRVDFRELVKDLAHRFRTRIEMRQIGVRDEARVKGGCGSCGRPLCCTTFLTQFEPISIKMAKHQSLSLNPSKISGLCGRLMCCLRYEFEHDAEKAVDEAIGLEIMEEEFTEEDFQLLESEEEDVGDETSPPDHSDSEEPPPEDEYL